MSFPFLCCNLRFHFFFFFEIQNDLAQNKAARRGASVLNTEYEMVRWREGGRVSGIER